MAFPVGTVALRPETLGIGRHMANALFNSLEKAITANGTEANGAVDLSELSLITGEDRSISFAILGTDFILTPEGDVVTVDGTAEEPETYAVEGDMKKSVGRFLNWRLNFITEFGL